MPAPASLTLDPFATSGYLVDGGAWHGVQQDAISITLPNADGLYWIALHRDIATSVGGWTRVTASHYLWQQSATRPSIAGGMLFL